MSTFFFLILASVVFFGIFGIQSELFKRDPTPQLSCTTGDLSGNFDPSAKLAYFEGREIPVSVVNSGVSRVLGSALGEKWVEVDLSEQKLRAWEGDGLFLETLVSTGLPGTPTPKGEFRIWIKLRHTKMEGGEGKDYYYLPNVPFVMFFEGSGIPGWKGYGLHGTYWHNDFGNRRSHGCINLPTQVAEKIYFWATPTLQEGKNTARTTSDDPGTRIVIHD